MENRGPNPGLSMPTVQPQSRNDDKPVLFHFRWLKFIRRFVCRNLARRYPWGEIRIKGEMNVGRVMNTHLSEDKCFRYVVVIVWVNLVIES